MIGPWFAAAAGTWYLNGPRFSEYCTVAVSFDTYGNLIGHESRDASNDQDAWRGVQAWREELDLCAQPIIMFPFSLETRVIGLNLCSTGKYRHEWTSGVKFVWENPEEDPENGPSSWLYVPPIL
jgi:hypothetical protein